MTVYPDGFSLSLSIFQQILYLTHPCGGQCGLLNTSHCLRSEAGDFIRDARARQTSLLWATWTQTPPSTPNQLPACRLLTLPEPLKSGRFYSDGGIWTVFSKPNSLIIPLSTVHRWWLTSCEEWSLRGCIVFFQPWLFEMWEKCCNIVLHWREARDFSNRKRTTASKIWGNTLFLRLAVVFSYHIYIPKSFLQDTHWFLFAVAVLLLTQHQPLADL